MSDDLGTELLALARKAIDERLGRAPQEYSPATTVDRKKLQKPGATFVTLRRFGQLRGCIGSLEAWRPLAEDVASNALAAAFNDPRFPPVSPAEWPDIRIEVSLLSPPEPLLFVNEDDALAQLRPGIDGVILTGVGRRSTYLPQVWEQLPEPVDFLTSLKRKAGLPADWWGPDVRLQRYGVTKWKEAS
jgi:AmmeMemoRadiSam system protein A